MYVPAGCRRLGKQKAALCLDGRFVCPCLFLLTFSVPAGGVVGHDIIMALGAASMPAGDMLACPPVKHCPMAQESSECGADSDFCWLVPSAHEQTHCFWPCWNWYCASIATHCVQNQNQITARRAEMRGHLCSAPWGRQQVAITT